MALEGDYGARERIEMTLDWESRVRFMESKLSMVLSLVRRSTMMSLPEWGRERRSDQERN